MKENAIGHLVNTNPIQTQFKPNLVRRRRIANSVNTTIYEIFLPLAGQKNKPNSNPIKPNCRKGKIDAKCVFTKDYEEKCG